MEIDSRIEDLVESIDPNVTDFLYFVRNAFGAIKLAQMTVMSKK